MTRDNLIPQIISRVKRLIHSHQMIVPGEQIGIGVSGGIDSVVLLDILANIRETLHISMMILHLNHGIRGKEADRDQHFVQDLSKNYALPCFTRKVDIPHYLDATSLSLQEGAREMRYRFFEDMMETHKIDKVALGQTADDQAETVLMRFIKGGGARGLKGIPYVREEKYVRPLLDIWREEIRVYAQQRGLPFVEDSSNLNMKYLRNRIRHELIPYLKDYNPRIKQRLVQLSQLLGEDDLYLEWLTETLTKKITQLDNEVAIPISLFIASPLPLQARVLQTSFARISSGSVLAYPHIRGIMRMVREGMGTKKVSLPGGLWAIKVYDTLFLRKGEWSNDEGLKEITLQVPGWTPLQGLGIGIDATVLEGHTSPPSEPREAYLDYDRLDFPLLVRSYQPGDSFIPMGMKGKKKIKKFFIDLKIPRAERRKLPLVITGDTVCWVAGCRIDERFKINEGTKKTLKLTLR
jgi:tRNA(Ile)-lysidine synthase